MTGTLLSQIRSKYDTFSKSHRKIADYILENYDKAAFMTAAKLGAATGISESTVVRFATCLGYDGYPEFQDALVENIKSKLTAAERMDVTADQLKSEDVIHKVLSADIAMIQDTLDNVSRADFNGAVRAINNARHIYVLGVRSSASLASFLGFYLNFVYENVKVVDTGNPTAMFEQIFRINSDDVCIAISFPRYSKQTLDTIRYIKGKKATVIAVTDSQHSPIAKYADYTLAARSSMASYIDSLVAPLSLVNALIVASTIEKRDEVAKTFNDLENIWNKYDVYEKPEDDVLE